MAIARGYAATDASKPLTPFTFERREPNPDDVVIAIKYCGVCHSDIHMVDNGWGQSVYPIVPGHEIAGVVTAVGANVTKFKEGDPVGVGCFVDSCVTCKAARDLDREQYQPGLVLTYSGFEPGSDTPTYGGYSDHIVVKEDYVLSIPGNLPLDAATGITPILSDNPSQSTCTTGSLDFPDFSALSSLRSGSGSASSCFVSAGPLASTSGGSGSSSSFTSTSSLWGSNGEDVDLASARK